MSEKLQPRPAALPAVTPGVRVKPLDRAQGQDKHAGWTLPMELLCAIKDEIRPSGYGGAVCLEEVEMIALAVEARILAEMDLTPQFDEAEKWKRAFAAQSSKLQAVLHIPGVKDALAAMEGKP